MSNTESIGKRIKRLRKERGMTQEELAGAVGVSPQAVSKWENDYSCPDISILPALAEVFGISTDELLSGNAKSEAAEGEFVENPDGNRMESAYNGKKKKRRSSYGFVFDRVSPDKLWFGIFIIVAGAMLILRNAANIIPWGFWDIMWPSALICIGMAGICKRPRVFNTALTLFGVYILLCNTDVIPSTFSGKWFVVGVLLIICGVSAVMPKSFKIASIMRHGKHAGVARELRCENGYINYEGTFCSDQVAFDGSVLHGGHIEALFGNFIIDLTSLTMVGENAALNVEVSFASLTLLVPRTVRVTEARDTAFGSVNIKGRAYDDAPYSLTVSSDVSFGSLDIKYV